MAGGCRWLAIILAGLSLFTYPVCAQQAQPASSLASSPIHSAANADRAVTLGRALLRVNNPDFADPGVNEAGAREIIALTLPQVIDETDKHFLQDLSSSMHRLLLDNATPDVRNDARETALSYFHLITKIYPDSGEAWFWLGITLTQTLQYPPNMPDGHAVMLTAEQTKDALDAFEKAYKRNQTDLKYVSYYSETLMLAHDFDNSRKLWDTYGGLARTDVQRMIALTQSARACLNKAYFGKMEHTLSADEVRQFYQLADQYTRRAAALCPNADDVKEMQGILKEKKRALNGK